AADVLTMLRPSIRRLVSAAVLALVLLGCGEGGGEGVAESARSRSVPDLTVGTVPASETTAPPVDPPPLLPWQVLVAVAKPDVPELVTYDAHGGDPVRFELALTNPWYFGGELALLVEEGRETD